MRKYYSNNLFLKGFRKKLRNNSTSAEAALWNLLKSKKINGRKFRRQHGFGFLYWIFIAHQRS
jgi:very-short-patch-repair endonuclease